MIVCPRCGKENQDHYKFCLGCGAELPRDAAHAPKSFSAPTPPAGFQSGGGGGQAPPAAGPPASFGAPPASFGAPAAPAAPPAPASAAPPAPVAGGDTVDCSKCGSSNNAGFKFCGTCGHNLQAGPSAAPPAPAAAPVAAPASGGAHRGTLVLIRPDGSEGDSFPLQESTTIGREAGGLFASDSYLSPRHASFQFSGNTLTVTDLESLNAVYVRIAPDAPTELLDRAVFRIGQEILRFERLTSKSAPGGVEPMGSPNDSLIGRICLIIGRETTGNCYTIPAHGLHMGRERGDILYPDDGYVSGLHCRLHEEGGRMMLTDVGSSNGTFVRLAGPTQIQSGSMLLMGQQLFRVEF